MQVSLRIYFERLSFKHNLKASCFVFNRLKTFKASLFKLFKSEHAQSVSMDKVLKHVNKENAGSEFSEDEVHAAIEKMQEDNQVMLSDNVVFLI